MKTIYTYVLNTLADWEAGLALAELNTQRFFSSPEKFEVKTVALNKEPVRTMGGITILPDYELSEVTTDNAALLILPGAEEWTGSKHHAVLDLAKQFLENHFANHSASVLLPCLRPRVYIFLKIYG